MCVCVYVHLFICIYVWHACVRQIFGDVIALFYAYSAVVLPMHTR
jgi:hypothetical protein